MPSFSDSIFLFILALLLFGPKKLPMLARELGKWVGEFRRASNEFKMQMEDELRQVEQADRLRKIEAMEAAAPVAPELEAPAMEASPIDEAAADPLAEVGTPHTVTEPLKGAAAEATLPEPATAVEPLPIAEAGEVKIMPPATGLPTPRRSGASRPGGNALGGLLDSIPVVDKNGAHETETVSHAD